MNTDNMPQPPAAELTMPTADELFSWARPQSQSEPQSESSIAWELADQECARLIAEAMRDESPPFPPKKNSTLGPEMATTIQTRIIFIDQLRKEIRAYGISKLAREMGYSRKHVQRIASDQRNPSAKFLAAVGYKPIVVYKDLDSERVTLLDRVEM